MDCSLIERYIIEENIWCSCSNEAVDVNLFALRPSPNAPNKLIVLLRRPECVLSEHKLDHKYGWKSIHHYDHNVCTVDIKPCHSNIQHNKHTWVIGTTIPEGIENSKPLLQVHSPMHLQCFNTI
jgi:hypothetical protein